MFKTLIIVTLIELSQASYSHPARVSKFLEGRSNHLKWELGQDQVYSNLDSETLLNAQNAFVRFKGFYEGFYHGFYRNQNMDEDGSDMALCLSDESYESLDVIAGAIDAAEEREDYSKLMQGFTAVVRLLIDNTNACKFT